jgi:hypothetical protein
MMLAVLLMLILRLRQPDVAEALGRLFAPEGQRVGVPAQEPAGGDAGSEAVRPPKEAPTGKTRQQAAEVALGPTDEDPEEAEAARQEFQAITDGTLGIPVAEMFAYRRVVQWVLNQPASVLEKRAKSGVTLNDLMLSPDEYRGKLLKESLNARMIREDKQSATKEFGFPIYEVWGTTPDSGAWLYDVVVVDLPKGLPLGTRINVKMRVVGYFFKLQGYYPAKAKPGARPDRAPLLVGRVVWSEPVAAEAAAGSRSWSWVLLGAIGLLAALWLGLTVLVRRPRSRGSAVPTRRPGAMSMEEWLGRAAAGEAPDEGPDSEPQADGQERVSHLDGNGDGLDGAAPRAEN